MKNEKFIEKMATFTVVTVALVVIVMTVAVPIFAGLW